MSLGEIISIVSIVVVLVLAWSGALFWAIKWLLNRYHEDIKGRLNVLSAASNRQMEEIHRVDKEILKLHGLLPLEYVRREDSIRSEVVFHAKIDALAAKIDSLNVRGRDGH